MLADYKRSFLDFALAEGVLQFGRFELKSGRVSPWFFNAGRFSTGSALKKTGEYYAAALTASGLAYDCLLGPAYKGIPLAVATAIALAEHYQRDVPYLFNRKEAKDHGEGGVLVGSALSGRVVIVDDVITAGTAIREVMGLLEAQNVEQNDTNPARPVGVLVAIDREERGTGELSAIQEVTRDYGVSVVSVVGLGDILEYLTGLGTYGREIGEIEVYRAEYGVV